LLKLSLRVVFNNIRRGMHDSLIQASTILLKLILHIRRHNDYIGLRGVNNNVKEWVKTF